MTDLQTSLFIIGGAFLVGVISYNKWQEYKAKKSVERAFSGSHDDVLMTPKDGGEAPVRHEPKLFESELDSELDGRGDARQAAAAHDDIEQSAEQGDHSPMRPHSTASAAFGVLS